MRHPFATAALTLTAVLGVGGCGAAVDEHLPESLAQVTGAAADQARAAVEGAAAQVAVDAAAVKVAATMNERAERHGVSPRQLMTAMKDAEALNFASPGVTAGQRLTVTDSQMQIRLGAACAAVTIPAGSQPAEVADSCLP